jgi:hypothetical protein
MLFATDETGSFALQRATFDVSMLTTLVCPPSRRSKLARFVSERCAAWDLEELHGVDLDHEQRAEVALFLANQEIIWTASVIDNEIFPAADLREWSEGFLANFEETWAASQARGSTHPLYRDRGEQIRALLNRRDLGGSFVQFAIATPRHIHDAVQAAIRRYQGPLWRQDWESPELVFDKKDAYGSQLLESILFPILASSAMALDLPISYEEAEHPLRRRHRSASAGLDLVSFFGAQPRFESSTDDPLIQLADVTAWIAQRALLRPDDKESQNAYRQLRRRQFQTDVARFRFIARRRYKLTELTRYQHLIPGPGIS